MAATVGYQPTKYFERLSVMLALLSLFITYMMGNERLEFV